MVDVGVFLLFEMTLFSPNERTCDQFLFIERINVKNEETILRATFLRNEYVIS